MGKSPTFSSRYRIACVGTSSAAAMMARVESASVVPRRGRCNPKVKKQIINQKRMETFFKVLGDILADAANVLTIVASSIAIYLFIKNRKKISTAVDLLLNFSFHTTLGELKDKVERLNEYKATEVADVPEIKNILHEIAGQIKGNPRLSTPFSELLGKIERMGNAKTITEPHKRARISEIRERLKNISVENVESIAGVNHE